MDLSALGFHKEVQDYLYSCENLLAALSTRDTASGFSTEEREMLWYTVAQLQKVLGVWDNK